MHIGAAMFFTDYSMSPGELGKALEERGFESVWAPEHSHIPLTRKSPFPGGGDLPKKYYDAMDPFVALMAAAAATQKLKVGTGVCLVNQRDPIQTAKLVSSIDQLSGGRFLFGVGNGWNQDEMENHGTDFKSRHKLARERIEAMKAIWTEEEASYSGRYVNFERIWCWPKPAQKPHPPVMVGGNGPRVLDRVLAFGDEWMPNRMSVADLGTRIAELGVRASEMGRDRIPVTVVGAEPDPAGIEALARIGVDRVVFWLPQDGFDAVENGFGRYMSAINQFRRAA
jgi:probable F420-dependent oxidoreductase